MLNYSQVDDVFQAISVPARRLILEKLWQGTATVSELAGPLEMTLAAVIQHLQVLEQRGLVRTEKAGRVRSCSISPEGFEVAGEWIERCRASWSREPVLTTPVAARQENCRWR